MSSTPIEVYPCDRGMSGVGTRGFHHFQASPNGVVVCVYCGAKPKPTDTSWNRGQS